MKFVACKLKSKLTPKARRVVSLNKVGNIDIVEL